MKIVVRGTNWVGDAVMQIPALRRLRRAFPAARITLATRSWARGIFEDADFIDDILAFEKSDSVFRQARLWRAREFDAAILFTNSFGSAVVAALGGAKKRFGYATEHRGFLLSESFAVPGWKNARHEINYYLNLVGETERSLRGVGEAFDGEPEFKLSVSEDRETRARAILQAAGVDRSKKIVILCPGSTNSRAKRWPAASYARLNDKLQDELDCNVVLIGSPDEMDVSEEVAAGARKRPLILTGKTSLAEATALLSVSDLLVSNDTGPAHIGAALGTKTLVLFGPTNPRTTRPWDAEIIRKEVECSPCMLRDCPIDHRCMTRVSPEEVFEKAAGLLTSTRS